ncbi:MAG: peptidylprolyl isomerase [Ignavibacteriales bacterium]|nr:peptidylprolyl isomerase [Ignavibacteriales bacterium]
MVELLNVFTDIADSSVVPVLEKGLAEQDKVIRTAAERAYKAITGNDSPVRYITIPVEYKPFYKTEDLALLSKYSGAEITTSKGTIKITFEKEAAPFTVLNFILLAQKKFYDGLSFHRVVSNFVIQGGDPLGNGSGGPNYAIRSEVHPNVKYRSGAVGMASAGKDTEGSQWFITHCPTPHLDFRYTIFGYTKDAAVVDKIMVGDRIERIALF